MITTKFVTIIVEKCQYFLLYMAQMITKQLFILMALANKLTQKPGFEM